VGIKLGRNVGLRVGFIDIDGDKDGPNVGLEVAMVGLNDGLTVGDIGDREGS
jgi:hypothetical protein